MSEDRAERAKEYFYSGFNCAQSVAMALSDLSGLPTDTLKAVSAPFGGAHPDYSKAEIYSVSRQAMDEFSERFGTMTCAELLKDVDADSSPLPSERTTKYYAERPCAEIVAFAAKIAEKYLK